MTSSSPGQGSDSEPLHWTCGVSATGPLGQSLCFLYRVGLGSASPSKLTMTPLLLTASGMNSLTQGNYSVHGSGIQI